jgi:hypothetical protein
MPKLLLHVVFVAGLIPSLAFGGEIVGYYEAQPDVGGARNRFCIEQGANGLFNVAVATAYCPSKECLNARIGGIQFQSRFKNNRISYTPKPECTLVIHFTKDGARIAQKKTSCDGENHYLYAEGLYKHVSSEPDRSSCRLE